MRYRPVCNREKPEPHNEIQWVCKGEFSSYEPESTLHLQFPLSSTLPLSFQTRYDSVFYESVSHLMYNEETHFFLAAGELADSLVNKRTKSL